MTIGAHLVNREIRCGMANGSTHGMLRNDVDGAAEVRLDGYTVTNIEILEDAK